MEKAQYICNTWLYKLLEYLINLRMLYSYHVPHSPNKGSIQVFGDMPTLPWVRSRGWIGARIGLALREGWVDTSPETLIGVGTYFSAIKVVCVCCSKAYCTHSNNTNWKYLQCSWRTMQTLQDGCYWAVHTATIPTGSTYSVVDSLCKLSKMVVIGLYTQQ